MPDDQIPIQPVEKPILRSPYKEPDQQRELQQARDWKQR